MYVGGRFRQKVSVPSVEKLDPLRDFWSQIASKLESDLVGIESSLDTLLHCVAS